MEKIQVEKPNLKVFPITLKFSDFSVHWSTQMHSPLFSLTILSKDGAWREGQILKTDKILKIKENLLSVLKNQDKPLW